MDETQLAPYAARPGASRGRLHGETESAHRSPFQRDRDRIIHSSAFRRLKHKTQVFVEHEGLKSCSWLLPRKRTLRNKL